MNISTNELNKKPARTRQVAWYQSIIMGIITLLLCISAPRTFAQYKYVGVWDNGSGTNLITKPLSWKHFLKKGAELTKKGLRLDDFEVIRKGTKKQYIGSWRNGSGNNIITKGLTWKAFLKKGEELTKKGYRLWDFETFNQFGKRLYVGNWRAGTGNNIITKGLPWKDFLKKGEQLTAKGYRLWDFEVYKIGRKYRYVGNWRSGSGSNIITKALRWNKFIKKGNELTKKGLRLYDVEIIKVGNFNKYVGAWRSGTGSNIITKGLSWNNFLSKGKQLTSKGLRLTDFEPFFIKQRQPKPNPSTTNSGKLKFTDTPKYIKLLNGTLGRDKYRVVVDFTAIIDDQPTITIPTQFLKYLPNYEGDVIFPNNFCGLRIIKASRFIWLDRSGNVFDDFPYNYVPENTSINQLFPDGETLHKDGIDFTGPVGKCANGYDNWKFPFPYTQTQTAMPQPLKLVIELESDSEIEFLHFNFKPRKSLSYHELFKKVDYKKMIKHFFDTFDSGFKVWIDKICKQTKSECPKP